MQTFLPFPDCHASAKALDNKRLGKQRVEAQQILNIISGNTTKLGWQNHPAVLMWVGYDTALKYYVNCCIREWLFRGFKNNMEVHVVDPATIVYPPWFGNEKFHAAHRSNLLRKDHSFYSKFGWQERTNLDYVWPVRKST
jgi:hypothetical protein